MHNIRRLLAILLLCGSGWATTTITGHIQNLGASNITSGAFVRFWLRGCGGNQPTVIGTGIIGPSQGGVFYFDITANSSGLVSGTIYSTRDATGLLGGDISCGGSTTAVWYGMQVFQNGKGGPETAIHAKSGATLDITSVTPITTNPVITAPSGDSTYARLDGGNLTTAFIKAVTGYNTFAKGTSATFTIGGNSTTTVSIPLSATFPNTSFTALCNISTPSGGAYGLVGAQPLDTSHVTATAFNTAVGSQTNQTITCIAFE